MQNSNSTSNNSAILNEDFDRSFPPPGWTTFIGKNGIGDEDNWGLRFPSTAAVESEDVDGGLAEDWLVTPSLRPSAENSTFTFDAKQDAEGDQGSIYTVRVSTKSQNNPDDFEIVQTYTEADLGIEDNTATLTADLSAYQGQDIYVALVMENDNGDEFILEKAGGIPLTPNQILVSQYGDEAVLSRGGANEVVQVELTSKPESPVTLNFSTGTEEILPVESVTFTPENWQETQNVSLELAQFGSTGEPETNFDLNIAVETIDSAYSQVSLPAIEGTIVDSGIPEFPSYRTVEETYADLANLAEDNPDIAEWVDIGDSYDKVTPGGSEGDDIYAIELTNENSEIADEDKPTLYVEGAIHAREYTTSELVTRFAEELVAGYGENADTTWILDNFKVAVVPIVNPDGRNFAEEGFLWRKNTNPNPPPGEEPAPFSEYGVDLNRNFDEKWGEIEGGSSNDPARFDYRGTEAFSEPETQAVRDYVTSLFPDQKAPGFEAAPNDTTGVFLDVHSFGNLVLYPFSWTDLPAGNKKELETLGRKFGHFTGVDGEAYNVTQWISGLYATDGDSMSWAYNEFGVASYTLELGTEFFQDTEDFESTIVPELMPALMYAAKTAYRPYQQPAGPETLEVSTDLTQVVAGTEVVLSATADDTRYDDGEIDRLDSEDEPVQNIAQARYTIDTPPWQEGAEFFNLEPADGELDSSVEELTAKIDTSNLSPGRHTIFIESQDADGNFGVPRAVFIDVLDASKDADIDNTNLVDTFTETDLQVPYSNLIVFGDSLSDTGNVFNATGGLIPPSPLYDDGRFSNGDLLVDAIAESLELPENESFQSGGNNYAFGAAQTGEGTSEYGFLLPEPIDVPNIGQQIDLYLADRTPTQTDLFYVYGGTNDFISSVLEEGTLPTAETIVGNITTHITELAEAGAQNFVVPNLPSLGDIPLFNGQPEATTILNGVTEEFNQLLDTELDAIASELNVEIIEPDIYSIATEIQNNPADFGLSNTTDAFFARIDPISDPTNLSLTGNPEEFFFWDIFHPTATATEIIAQEVVAQEFADNPQGNLEACGEYISVFGTTEEDTLDVTGTKLVFAGSGNDTVNVSEGDNRIYGGGGDDAFFLGTGDYVVGGEGSDQFWVADTELPDTANRIADFELGSDVIGFSNLGTSFEDLTLTQDGDNALIALQEKTVAILTNIDANSLDADNFAFN